MGNISRDDGELPQGTEETDAAPERTALYRVYDENDELLYIGIAKNFGRRWQQHSEKQPWWPQVQRQTVAWHESRKVALAEEALAIKAEKPKFNSLPPFHGSQPVASERAVGQRFRELRESARMSQEALAAAMVQRGWPWYQSTIYRIESGKQALRVGELVDLAQVFGVPPGRLLGEIDARALADERLEMERTLREQIAAEIAGAQPKAAA